MRAIVCLAERGEAMTARDIADEAQVPPGYMAKVLQALAKQDIVESRRGLGGGFRLKRPAERISLLEVINAVDPIKRIESCPLGLERHGTNLCALHRKINESILHVEQMLSSRSIGEILKEEATHARPGLCKTQRMA